MSACATRTCTGRSTITSPSTAGQRLAELIDPDSRADNDNWGPRFGLAWDVRSDGRTVARLAAGKYYSNVFANTLRNEVNALLQSQVNIRNPSYPDPYGGLSPQAFVTVSATPNVSITSDEIEQPESVSFNVGLSHELRPNLASTWTVCSATARRATRSPTSTRRIR